MRAFTLLEVLTVLLVIGLLFTMLIPTFASFRDKAERASCTNNLANLYYAANAHVQEQGRWPQIPAKDVHNPSYALAWQAALAPYGIGQKNWICPSMQRQMRNPDYTKDKSVRVDYMATPFKDDPRAAYKWPTMPWFLERGDVHGVGNLVIFADGHVQPLKEIVHDPRFQSASPF